jgi:selenocysteine lyase/cysteine desulfurase
MRAEIVARARPLAAGALSYGTPDDLASADRPLRADSRRFEPGTLPAVLLSALAESVTLLNQTGIDIVAAEALRLARSLRAEVEGLGYRAIAPHGMEQRSPILTIAPGPGSRWRDLAEMETALAQAGISYHRRGGGVRLSPHAFNDDGDVARVRAAWA